MSTPAVAISEMLSFSAEAQAPIMRRAEAGPYWAMSIRRRKRLDALPVARLHPLVREPVARHLARTCWLLRNWPRAC